jgi:hypothetical protein
MTKEAAAAKRVQKRMVRKAIPATPVAADQLSKRAAVQMSTQLPLPNSREIKNQIARIKRLLALRNKDRE